MKVSKKRFAEWIKIKEEIHDIGAIPPLLKDGEIWWCAFGENVGIEINGKNAPFSRPVFIYKKLSRDGFMGIPLTSGHKVGSWYVNFDFQTKQQTACLSQARVMSSSRLLNRMGRLDDRDIAKIKAGFKKLYK
jgi:mRNA interferase MazF